MQDTFNHLKPFIYVFLKKKKKKKQHKNNNENITQKNEYLLSWEICKDIFLDKKCYKSLKKILQSTYLILIRLFWLIKNIT